MLKKFYASEPLKLDSSAQISNIQTHYKIRINRFWFTRTFTEKKKNSKQISDDKNHYSAEAFP